MTNMEANLLALLTASQSSADGPRQAAEQELLKLNDQQLFPEALVNIASNGQVATNNRQAALNLLHLYVKKGWAVEIPDFQGVILPNPDTKHHLRVALLNLIFDDNVDSKVTNGAAIIISKIAQADYPQDWPRLFEDLLGKIPSANNAQTQGILTVLSTLIECGGVDEEAFKDDFKDIMSALHGIAVSDGQRPQTRAHALRVFGQSFDSIWLIKENDKVLARYMTQQALDLFSPFFLQVLTAPMPTMPTKEQEDKGEKEAMEWRGMVQLKTQVIKVSSTMYLINENDIC